MLGRFAGAGRPLPRRHAPQRSRSGADHRAGAPALVGADPEGIGAEWWVLWVDADYRTLAVGTPDGRFGFILNRDGALPPDRLAAAREILEWNGYDLARLRPVCGALGNLEAQTPQVVGQVARADGGLADQPVELGGWATRAASRNAR